MFSKQKSPIYIIMFSPRNDTINIIDRAHNILIEWIIYMYTRVNHKY